LATITLPFFYPAKDIGSISIPQNEFHSLRNDFKKYTLDSFLKLKVWIEDKQQGKEKNHRCKLSKSKFDIFHILFDVKLYSNSIIYFR